MIGKMIKRIRKEKGMTKTKLSELTDINIGHLTHIEKGERNPSHKTLKAICKALKIPYQPIYYTYDKKLTQEQEEYNYIKHISYDRIPLVEKLSKFVEYPVDMPNVSFAYRVLTDEMSPLIKENAIVYIEQNTTLDNKEIGLFYYNGEYIMRRLLYRKESFVLKADNKDIPNITIGNKDEFFIIGKVYL